MNNPAVRIGFCWVNDNNAKGVNPSVAIDNIRISPYDEPTADFDADSTNICTGSCVTFTDKSAGNITEWTWTFTGGTPSSYIGKVPPKICYNTPGNYDVQLEVSDGVGQNTNTKTSFIVVKTCIGNQLSANFTSAGTHLCETECIEFEDLTTGGTKPYTYSWEFSGGNPTADTAANPTVCYSTEGKYDVQLTVTDALGNTASKTIQQYITVDSCVSKPHAAFWVSRNFICPDDCIHFTDISPGSPTSWKWTFNGGTPQNSNAQHPDNICYGTPGIYDVELIVTNAAGADTSHISGYIVVGLCNGINNIETAGSIAVYPNPFSSSLYVATDKNLSGAEILIHDILGKVVKRIDCTGEKSLSINSSELTQGIYSLSIIYSSGERVEQRIVKM